MPEEPNPRSIKPPAWHTRPLDEPTVGDLHRFPVESGLKRPALTHKVIVMHKRCNVAVLGASFVGPQPATAGGTTEQFDPAAAGSIFPYDVIMDIMVFDDVTAESRAAQGLRPLRGGNGLRIVRTSRDFLDPREPLRGWCWKCNRELAFPPAVLIRELLRVPNDDGTPRRVLLLR